VACEEPMILDCDKSAISIVHNPVQYERTTHTKIDGHFIKEIVVLSLLPMSHLGFN